MKNRTIAASFIVSAACVPAAAMADMSANIGYLTDYIYRGVFQSTSVATGGLDFETDSGFYIGTWGADVDNGLEYDVYFGYGGGGDNFGYSIGYTGYFYTENSPNDNPFWDTISEVNLGISAGIFALDYAVGQDDGPQTLGFTLDTQDYTWTAVTISPEVGPYYKYAVFGDDYDGSYFEMGYTFDFMGLDLNITLLYDLDEDDPTAVTFLPGGADTSLVFGITKGIDIGN